jgi:hypothetical protein
MAFDLAARVYVSMRELDKAAAYNRRAIEAAEERGDQTVLFEATKELIRSAKADTPLNR